MNIRAVVRITNFYLLVDGPSIVRTDSVGGVQYHSWFYLFENDTEGAYKNSVDKSPQVPMEDDVARCLFIIYNSSDGLVDVFLEGRVVVVGVSTTDIIGWAFILGADGDTVLEYLLATVEIDWGLSWERRNMSDILDGLE